MPNTHTHTHNFVLMKLVQTHKPSKLQFEYSCIICQTQLMCAIKGIQLHPPSTAAGHYVLPLIALAQADRINRGWTS